MNDSKFLTLMNQLGADEREFIHERGLFRAGFKPVGAYCGEELWEDPLDPAEDGGVWVGRSEALRRVRVRVLQAKHGFGPLIEHGQVHDPFGGTV